LASSLLFMHDVQPAPTYTLKCNTECMPLLYCTLFQVVGANSFIASSLLSVLEVQPESQHTCYLIYMHRYIMSGHVTE
jgi:hypothetical protein